MIPAHAHPITDLPHTHISPAHNHTQNPHTHTAAASAGDSGQHVHGSNLLKFVGSGGTLFVGASGVNNVTTGNNTDPSNAPGINTTVTVNANTATNIAAAATINAANTGLTTTQTSAAPTAQVPVMQPWIAATKIIRAK